MDKRMAVMHALAQLALLVALVCVIGPPPTAGQGASASTSPSLRVLLLAPFAPAATANHTAALRPALAALMAAAHIAHNDTSVLPALAGRLHPQLRLQLLLRDGGPDAAASLSHAFDGWRDAGLAAGGELHAALGPDESARCAALQHVAAAHRTAHLGAACAQAKLSDRELFPTFMRLVPSELKQGVAAARLAAALGWRRVALLAASSARLQAIADAFAAQHLRGAQHSLLARVPIPEEASDGQLHDALAVVQRSGATVIVLVATAEQAARIHHVAVSDPLLSLTDARHAWLLLGGAMDAQPISEEDAEQSVGFLAIGRESYNGFNGAPFAALQSHWSATNLSDPIFAELVAAAANTTGSAAQLLDSMPSSAPLHYDTVVALALAASNLLFANRTITAAGMLEQLRSGNVTFDGVSGRVQWDDNGDGLAPLVLLNRQRTSPSAPPSSFVTAVAGLIPSDDGAVPGVPSEALANLRFRDGSNVPPSSETAALTLTWLLSGRQAGHAVPVDASMVECTFDAARSEWTVTGSSTGSTACFGGFARRAAYVSARRALTSDLLVIDSGGSFFGTPFQDVDDGVSMARMFDATGYDAYDSGVSDWFLADTFASFIMALPRPCQSPSPPDSGLCIVTSNLDVSGNARLSRLPSTGAPLIRRFIAKTMRDGALVGIISAVQVNLASQVALDGVRVGFSSALEDPYAILRADLRSAIAALLMAHPDCAVVALVGDQNGDAIRVLADLPEVKVVLTVLAGGATASPAALGLTTADELIYYSPTRPDVPIVHVDTLKGYGFTDASLSFTADGLLIPGSVRAHFVNLTTPPAGPGDHPTVSALLHDTHARVTQLNQLVVAHIGATLDGGRGTGTLVPGVDVSLTVDGCRVSDCAMGMVVTDAMLNECSDCWFAHINGGAIRDSLHYRDADGGAVTRGNVFSVLPFSNYMVTYTLSGSGVQTLLQKLVSQWNSGSWPAMSGVRVAWSPLGAKSTASFKLVYAELRNPVTREWEPLQTDAYYRIATNDYIAAQLPVLVGGATGVTSGAVLLDVTQRYLATSPSLPPRSLVSACAWDVVTLPMANTAGGVVERLNWPAAYADCRTVRAHQTPFVPCGTNEVRMSIRGAPVCVCIAGYMRQLSSGSGSGGSTADTYRCQPCPRNTIKLAIGDHSCVCDQTFYNISALTYALEPMHSGSGAVVAATAGNVTRNVSATDPPRFIGLMRLRLLACVDLSGSMNFAGGASVPLNFTEATPFLWQHIPMDYTCQPCPSCMACARGREVVESANATAGSSVAAAGARSDVTPLASFWWSGASPNVYSCPSHGGAKCVGDRAESCERGYEGLLCTQCSTDFGSLDGNTCSACAGRDASRAIMALVVLAVLVYVAFTLRSAFNVKSGFGVCMKILSAFLHVNTFILKFQLGDSSILATASGALGFSSIGASQSLSYSCAWHADAIDKSILVTAVLLAVVAIALLNRVFSWTCKRRMQVRCKITQQNKDAAKSHSSGGSGAAGAGTDAAVAARDDANFRTGAAVVPLSSSSASLEPSIVAPQFNERRAELRAFPACVVLLFLLYPAVVQESLSLIRACWSVDGTYRMAADLSIQCDSARFRGWRAAAWAKFSCLGIAFPIAIFIVLWRREKQGRLYEEAFFVRFRCARLAHWGRQVCVRRVGGWGSFFDFVQSAHSCVLRIAMHIVCTCACVCLCLDFCTRAIERSVPSGSRWCCCASFRSPLCR